MGTVTRLFATVAALGTVFAALPAHAFDPDVADRRLRQAFWDRNLTAMRTWHEALVVSTPRVGKDVVTAAHFWREVIALADCESLAPAHVKPPPVLEGEWAIRTALVRLERLRLRRGAAGERVGLASDLLDPTFFARPVVETPPDRYVRWPVEDELWSDELPILERRAARCGPTAALDGDVLARRLQEELAWARVIEAAMPIEHPASFRVRAHQAAIHLRTGRPDGAIAAMRPLFQRSLPSDERATMLVFLGMDRDRAEDAEGALEAYGEAMRLAPDHRAKPFVRLRIGRLLLAANRPAELLALLPTSIDAATAGGRWDAWLKARALTGLSRWAELLSVARTVLRAPGADEDDPTLQAVADLAYAYLATVPFDERVIELVESFGDPRRVYERLERFAKIAGDREETKAAEAALSWLLAHHQNAHYRPRYEAGLASLAFDRSDARAFSSRLTALAKPDERLLAVIPPHRRGAFWVERDQRLLGLVRHVVPRLPAEPNPAFAEAIVRTLQSFLRDAPESRVHAELEVLYRSARAVRAETAPGYSERIGGRPPAMALGEVRVLRPLPEPPAPVVAPRIDEPESLLDIPRADGRGTRAWFAKEGA